MRIPRIFAGFVMVLAIAPRTLAQPSSTHEAIRGLTSQDGDFADKCALYLKDQYSESRGVMIRWLDCEQGTFAKRLTGAFALVGQRAIPDLMRILPESNKRVRLNVLNAMRDMGKEARAAVPQLHEELGSSEFEVREAALEALGQIRDQRSLPLISKCLQDKHRRVRVAAMDALTEFGADARPAIGDIIRAVKSNNGGVSASLCLGRIGRSCIPILEKEVANSANPARVRCEFIDAITAMANYGPKGDAVVAIPILRKIIEDNKTDLRKRALETLIIICHTNSKIDADKEFGWLFNPRTIKSLSANDRVRVADIAARFNKHRNLAVTLFDEALRSSDPHLVRYAVAACLSLEEDRPMIAAGLERAMRSTEPGVRWLAVRRVTADPRYFVTVPRLLWIAVSDENKHCRNDALRAIVAVGNAVWTSYVLPDFLKRPLLLAYTILVGRVNALLNRPSGQHPVE